MCWVVLSFWIILISIGLSTEASIEQKVSFSQTYQKSLDLTLPCLQEASYSGPVSLSGPMAKLWMSMEECEARSQSGINTDNFQMMAEMLGQPGNTVDPFSLSTCPTYVELMMYMEYRYSQHICVMEQMGWMHRDQRLELNVIDDDLHSLDVMNANGHKLNRESLEVCARSFETMYIDNLVPSSLESPRCTDQLGATEMRLLHTIAFNIGFINCFIDQIKKVCV